MMGLTGAEAAASREKWGDNRLSEQKQASFWAVLGGNFSDPMIKILCAALFVNVCLVIASAAGWIPDEAAWYEPVGIALAILLATFVSTFSEYRNENAFRRLQEDASRISCKVWRDGVLGELSIDDIVTGDVVLLQTGDKIPADGIVAEGSLKVDQAALNGESKEARKIASDSAYSFDTAKIDFLDSHRLFRGAVVVSGSAQMQVTVVGDASVYGGIARELQTDDERGTPLQIKLKALARGISFFGYIGGIVIALALLFQRIVIEHNFNGAEIIAYVSNWTHLLNDIIHAVMLAVIIIVMAVPEGLPLMIAIVSALNMGKMLKDNVLVRKIAGIETAGSLNFLFCDKTGTITKGKLDVMLFSTGNGVDYSRYNDIDEGLRRALSDSVFYNTGAVLSDEGSERRAIGGNGTERALCAFAASEQSEHAKIIEQISFSSAKKFSAATISKNNSMRTLIKGAPEKILSKCAFCLNADGNTIPFSNHAQLNAKIDELAARTIRVIAFAQVSEQIINPEESLDDILPPASEWTLVGIVGIRDDVRPESKEAIAEVQNAGIQVVMITGDRKETALAIAKEAGLFTGNNDIVLSSDELTALSDDELKAKLLSIRVIARALPADKSRLVRIAQEEGFVAGMTGDGVNDSPALKKADVGFAMGGGTEVAKEASEIVILDDNFSSIENAILYGRTIYNSIRKFIIFQLTINVAAVLVTFTAPLLGRPNPLSITQILWINLIIDTLAALAFGGEPALRRFMNEKPKRREESIISPYMWGAIISDSLWTFALSCAFLFLPVFKNYFGAAPDTFHTGFFAFFVFTAVFNAFNARTEKLNLFDNIGGNKGFARVLSLIVVVQVALIYLGREIFNCFGLGAAQWIIVLCMAFTIIPFDLARKILPKSKKGYGVK